MIVYHFKCSVINLSLLHQVGGGSWVNLALSETGSSASALLCFCRESTVEFDGLDATKPELVRV